MARKRRGRKKFNLVYLYRDGARQNIVPSLMTRLRIHSRVKTIRQSRFCECKHIREIFFAERSQLALIDDFAFSKIPSLRFVDTFPVSLQHLGDYAFYDCQSLKTVNFRCECIIQTIGIQAFSFCPNLEQVKLSYHLRLIREGAFLSCTRIQEIDLPSSLAVIDDCAFDSCTSLVEVRFLSTERNSALLRIGRLAFSDCGNLKTFQLPKTDIEIGESAFFRCWKLTSMEYPYGCSVTLQSDNIFTSCDLLTIFSLAGSRKMGEFCLQVASKEVAVPTNDSFPDKHQRRTRRTRTGIWCDMPVHYYCYYSGETRHETDLQDLLAHNAGRCHFQTDRWGQSPFHVLFGSANWDLRSLQELLTLYPYDRLLVPDANSNWPLVSMLRSSYGKDDTRGRKAAVRLIMEWYFLARFPFGRPEWKVELRTKIEKILQYDDDIELRLVAYDDACEKFEQFAEIESIILFLWKVKTSRVQNSHLIPHLVLPWIEINPPPLEKIIKVIEIQN